MTNLPIELLKAPHFGFCVRCYSKGAAIRSEALCEYHACETHCRTFHTDHYHKRWDGSRFIAGPVVHDKTSESPRQPEPGSVTLVTQTEYPVTVWPMRPEGDLDVPSEFLS